MYTIYTIYTSAYGQSFILLKSRILVLLLYLVFFRRLGGNIRSLLCLIEINGQRFYYIVVAALVVAVVSLFVVVVALGFLVFVVLVIAFN